MRACADERWDARIAAVISNRADAAGLAFARERGIATEVVDHRAFANREAFDDALADAHRALTAPTSSRWPASCASSAPPSCAASTAASSTSILRCCRRSPGLETHRRAIEAGCKVSGRERPFRHRRARPRADHRPGGRAGARRRRRGGARGARPRAGASPLSARDRAGWSRAVSSAATASSAIATAPRSCCCRPSAAP